ncbi:hypothetical protein SDC9_176533 [bioreactor metagenome]|uniref:Uncharacterized protein n=1 Tax=bioreactor metagenome TaxID=1076179 RepID=A0A645GYH6_9ZZZZ
MAAHPGGQAARRVCAATVRDGIPDLFHVFPFVEVERRRAPAALWLRRLFFQRQQPFIPVNLADTAFAKAFRVRFSIAHGAGCAFVLRVADEPGQAEIQHVVAGDDQQVIIQAQPVDRVLDIDDRAKTGLVGACPVIHHCDGQFARLGPFIKMMGEFVVGDHDIFAHFTGCMDIIQQPVQDGLFANFQQGLGIVLCQRVEPGGVPGGQNQALHMSFLRLPVHQLTRSSIL